MFTGRRFRLTKGALAIEMGSGGSWVTIPAGEVLTVASDPDGEGDHRLVCLVWESRLFAMFAIELSAHGTEIKDRGANA